MQDFIDQARKNGIALKDKGKCPFCGADYPNGIFGCMDNYNNGLGLLDLNNSRHYISRFLSVDAHALQHPEIHGRWSNHFHLTRLKLILDLNVHWDYKKSPLLSDYLNAYKVQNPSERLDLPKPMERGKITSKDLAKAASADECVELIRSWAKEVYNAWSSSHAIVSEIAKGFLENNTI